MPVTIDDSIRAQRGVYHVEFAYLKEEMTVSDSFPFPRVILQFARKDEDSMLPMGIPANDELAGVVWRLTGEYIPTDTPEEAFAGAQIALKDLDWEGLVYVGGYGWVERIQVPPGAYNFKFVKIGVRDRDTGRASWFEITRDDGTVSQLSTVELVVVGGDYEGYKQEALFPVSFQVDKSKNLINISGQSALYKVMRAMGVNSEYFVTKVNEAEAQGESFFEDITNPLPELENMFAEMAENGHRLSGSVDEKGNLYWGTLTATGRTKTVSKSGPSKKKMERPGIEVKEDEARRWMTELSKLLVGEDNTDLFDDGDLTGPADEPGKGMYLAVNVIKPIAEAMPDSGVKLSWPPSRGGWSDRGAELVTDVFACLVAEGGEDEGRLLELVGSSDQSHDALKDFVVEVFGNPEEESTQSFG